MTARDPVRDAGEPAVLRARVLLAALRSPAPRARAALRAVDDLRALSEPGPASTLGGFAPFASLAGVAEASVGTPPGMPPGAPAPERAPRARSASAATSLPPRASTFSPPPGFRVPGVPGGAEVSRPGAPTAASAAASAPRSTEAGAAAGSSRAAGTPPRPAPVASRAAPGAAPRPTTPTPAASRPDARGAPAPMGPPSAAASHASARLARDDGAARPFAATFAPPGSPAPAAGRPSPAPSPRPDALPPQMRALLAELVDAALRGSAGAGARPRAGNGRARARAPFGAAPESGPASPAPAARAPGDAAAATRRGGRSFAPAHAAPATALGADAENPAGTRPGAGRERQSPLAPSAPAATANDSAAINRAIAAGQSDPRALAALVNDALIEQARRHGVDLS